MGANEVTPTTSSKQAATDGLNCLKTSSSDGLLLKCLCNFGFHKIREFLDTLNYASAFARSVVGIQRVFGHRSPTGWTVLKMKDAGVGSGIR
jgi:hypothetical protein